MQKRPDIYTYFFELAEKISTRSTCLRRQVGSVIVRDTFILSTGYNGAPSGCLHCEVVGCMRDKLGIASGERTELCRASHAEMNAICFAARNGVSLKGAEIYSSWQPCSLCSKLIINSGIHVVHFRREVPDKLGLELLAESGVKVVRHCIKLKDDKDEELKNKI